HILSFFCFTTPATTQYYTLSLHDALPILGIYPSQLYKWRKEAKEFGEGSFPGNGNLKQTPEQERILALEKKLKDVELEVSFLGRSEEHTSELQSRFDLVCRLLLEKKNKNS